MYCETCPVRNYCKAYEAAEDDDRNSYHHQAVVRVSIYDTPPCPLLRLIQKQGGKNAK